MDSDYLPYHINPSKPVFKLPEGAIDAHCHIFGPENLFPYAPQRKYTPCDAPKAQLFKLRDHLGFSRNVIVQASCHGTDNQAMIDALSSAGNQARGVAVVSEDISFSELEKMHIAGVRGVRFNFVKRLVDNVPRAVFQHIADKVRPLGWHIVAYFEAQDLEEITSFLAGLNMIIVIDHMGRPKVEEGLLGIAFQRFIQIMKEQPNFWVKVGGAERLTQTPPDYRDVVPFARKLIELFPKRVLWGTDWPHPNMKSHIPDDGQLVDLIPQIAPTLELQHQLLVINPRYLYWEE
ncbi:MAG: 2-pyrone-4,6-dicarbaxylate hydrolase [Candidatus Celerinatantimonas neptuna]|nr:MAG: 2-pyrone-4,6-dicarbaxylate hydrolase [Candidatus Celerinatantimonas neptuna]